MFLLHKILPSTYPLYLHTFVIVILLFVLWVILRILIITSSPHLRKEP